MKHHALVNERSRAAEEIAIEMQRYPHVLRLTKLRLFQLLQRIDDPRPEEVPQMLAEIVHLQRELVAIAHAGRQEPDEPPAHLIEPQQEIDEVFGCARSGAQAVALIFAGLAGALIIGGVLWAWSWWTA